MAAAADIADLQLFKASTPLLVEKAGVEPQDNGYFLAVVLADEPDDMRDHLEGGVPVVAGFAAAPEHRVAHQVFPGQVQGLNAASVQGPSPWRRRSPRLVSGQQSRPGDGWCHPTRSSTPA